MQNEALDKPKKKKRNHNFLQEFGLVDIQVLMVLWSIIMKRSNHSKYE